MGDMDDIEAIKQLKARYTRAVDTRNWQLMRRSVTDDVCVDVGHLVAKGGDVFVAELSAMRTEGATMHHACMPEIEITSPTTASGVWALRAGARFSAGKYMDGFGHYHDLYEKVDGEWLVKQTRIEWLHVDLVGFE